MRLKGKKGDALRNIVGAMHSYAVSSYVQDGRAKVTNKDAAIAKRRAKNKAARKARRKGRK